MGVFRRGKLTRISRSFTTNLVFKIVPSGVFSPTLKMYVGCENTGALSFISLKKTVAVTFDEAVASLASIA